MTLSIRVRHEIRRRAEYACEYCGITESDAGGELTVDHYLPTSKGGGDDIENLIYCCARCNQYKQDYWPEAWAELPLWNPRLEPRGKYFFRA